MPLRALFVDFNSYFASVEQQLQPRLRNKPVAVVPLLVDSTCCIATSYEAKRFGVKTGTPVWQARQLCPGIQFVEARPGTYVTWHHRLIEAVETCVHVTQVLSIDEMTCELSGAIAGRERSEKLARHIKATIARDVGEHLLCSIGIAPNTFLAKTATELEKPNGLVVIEERDLPHCLHVLKLRDLCGVGSRMHKRLQNHGIFSVEELCAARRETLRMVWGGIEGERMFLQLKGEEVWRPVTKRSSLGHSHVLPPCERTEEGARAVLSRLLQKAAMRLRKIAHAARGLQIFVRHIGEKSWSAHTTFKESDDTLFFIEVFCFLWAKRGFEYSNSQHPALQSSTCSAIVPLVVGVNLFHIKPIEGCTFSLFEQDEEHRKLNQSVDELNEVFGKNAVYLGGAHGALHAAPDKIAFNRIPAIDARDDALQHALEEDKARIQTQPVFAHEKPAFTKKTSEKRTPCARLFW